MKRMIEIDEGRIAAILQISDTIHTAAQRLSSMFRLLSERLTQKEAGWTKPLRATVYGISNDLRF